MQDTPISFYALIVVLGVLGAVALATGAVERRAKVPFHRGWMPWLILAGCTATTATVLLLGPAAAEQASHMMTRVWFIVGGGIVLAVLLYALREFRKDIYGVVEIATAMMMLSLLARTRPDFDLPSAVVVFVGSVYVFVRGLTNLYDARKERA